MDKELSVKDWLNRCRTINQEIDTLKEERQQAFDMCCNISSAIDDNKVQASKSNNTEDKNINYSHISVECDKKIAEFEAVRQEISDIINKIEDRTHWILLKRRYILCHKWEDISDYLGFKDRKSIFKLHNRILKEIEIIKEVSE